MYRLYSTRPGGGVITEHGEWPTMKMATLVARAIQAADPRIPREFTVRPDFRDVAIRVPLTPPEPAIDMEVALPDGRVLWADDIQTELDASPKFTWDLVYAVTTNGAGWLAIEDANGSQLVTRRGPDTDDHGEFVKCVALMLDDVELRV